MELTMHPNKLARLQLMDKLFEHKHHDWHLCILSHNRQKFALGRYLVAGCDQEFLDEYVTILVNDDEVEQYKKVNPEFKSWVAIPKECRGIGRLRDFMYKWAIVQGYKYALNFDDDVKAIEFLWEDEDANGFATMRHSTKLDRRFFPKLTQYVLTYFAESARAIFTHKPNVRFGAIRRQHFSNNVPPEQFARINGASTPRQAMIMKLDGYGSDMFPSPETDEHGDDIICALHIIAKRNEDLFSIQQITYDFVSEQVNSTLRDTDENTPRNHRLHREEEANICDLGLRHLLRTSKAYSNGDYMYGDIDWKAVKADGCVTDFHKISVTEMEKWLNE